MAHMAGLLARFKLFAVGVIGGLSYRSGAAVGRGVLTGLVKTIKRSVFRPGVLPRLNLGCGDHPLPGFINLDKESGWTFESGLPDFAAESVGGITISHALMYVAETRIPFVLSEFYRVLAPGGVVRITEDDTQNPEGFAFGGWRGDCPFVTLTSPSIVAGWLARAGFEVRHVDENVTFFRDRSLCQSVHRGSPHVFFIEGIRLGG